MMVWAFNPSALAHLADRFGVEGMDTMLGDLIQWAEDSPTRAFMQVWFDHGAACVLPMMPTAPRCRALRFIRRGHIITLGGVVVLRMIEVDG